jgi:hypothetical protein
VTSILSSGIVEVAVGLAFIYLLLSLLCSIVNEWIAGIMGSRAYNLERGIRGLFTNGNLNNATSLADALYAHGLIQSLYTRGFWDKIFLRRGGPSYIPPRLFATTLVNVLVPNATATADLDALRTAVSNLPASKGKEALAALVNQDQTKVEEIKKSLESWYSDGMDRIAGWYKRRTTLVLFALGLIIAVLTNTDSFLVARTLWNNPALRQATAAAADQYVQNYKPETGGSAPPGAVQVKTALDNLNSQLQTLQIPVGWPIASGGPSVITDVMKAVSTLFGRGQSGPPTTDERSFPTDMRLAWFRMLGWCFTAAALSLGAPFWFDLLNKFMVVRSAIKPEEKKKEADS